MIGEKPAGTGPRSGFVPVEYQFLHFNTAGVIDSAERVRLPGDDDALNRARSARSRTRIEVWSGSRCVGVVPPVSGAGAA